MNNELVAISMRESGGSEPEWEWTQSDKEESSESDGEEFQQPTRSVRRVEQAPTTLTEVENRYQPLELSPVTATGRIG